MGLSQSSLKSESLEYLVAAHSSYQLHTSVSHKNGPVLSNDCDCPQECSICGLTYHQTLSTFPATLTNCELRVVCKGDLELCTHVLIFRDRIGNSLTWPLETIRWFGENANFFVFESGRKSPSGPGLFVFKCKQAKQISKEARKQINWLVTLHSKSKAASLPMTQPSNGESSHRRVQLRFNVSHQIPVHNGTKWSNPSTDDPSESTVNSSYTGSNTLRTKDTLLSSGGLTESSSTISYPNMVGEQIQSEPAPRQQPEEAVQHDNYRSLASSETSLYSSSPGTSSGQYVIAAALHQYVNQPNGLLVSQHPLTSAPSQWMNEYLEAPI